MRQAGPSVVILTRSGGGATAFLKDATKVSVPVDRVDVVDTIGAGDSERIMSGTDFGLIGAAGYVARRHMQAIRDTGGTLQAALDPSDSVGIIDSFFPDAAFFTEFERFDRYVDLQRRQDRPLDYVSVCSPNYLHDAHCRFALRAGADAICEKPLVLNPWNADSLAEMEQATGRRIFTILQLRLHPAVRALKERIAAGGVNRTHDVDLTYIASRGRWYGVSWKGDVHKSGGIATNIGIHFFDMLIHVFGGIQRSVVHLSEESRSAGWLELERARVRWFLSIDRDDLPERAGENGSTYRSITVDGEAFEFSDGFADLHTESYRQILTGNGFGVEEARPSIEAVAGVRGRASTRAERTMARPRARSAR